MRRSFILGLLPLLAACSATPVSPILTGQALEPRGVLVKRFALTSPRTLTGARIEPTISVPRRSAPREDIWNALLIPPSPGNYTFEVMTNSQFTLTLNGTDVIATAETEAAAKITSTVYLDGVTQLRIQAIHSLEAPYIIDLAWGKGAHATAPLTAAHLRAQDLTADCDIQPFTHCRARVGIPLHISGYGLMDGTSADGAFPVQNLSELYPLTVRVTAPQLLPDTTLTLQPRDEASLPYTVRCPEHTGNLPVTVTRQPDAAALIETINVSCMGVGIPPQP